MIALKILLFLSMMAAFYAFGRFTGFIRGQAATIIFYEHTMKDLAIQVLKEYEGAESEVRSDY